MNSIVLILLSVFFNNVNAQNTDTSYKTLESITVVSRNLKLLKN